ncbi:MAG: GDP-mannose 4,6-dehydratase [Ktedonobacteraceae bacterium]|nr:GDP-mannose 4,6-dehydratase [Ktedonobacteraceae bacterium]
MRCLVTGAAGFIGSHLAEHLLSAGHEVYGLDSFTDYYSRRQKEQNLAGPRSWERFTFVEGDILQLHLPALLEGIDWIFHQAAQAGVRTSWGHHFEQYVTNNVLATQRLLDAALEVDTIKRFVYASSSSVYGDATTLPLTEFMPLQPNSPYGVTKLAAENLCMLYHRNFGVPVVALRYFTVYGPRQRPDMAFHRFCKAIIERQPITIYGDGQQTRDFTYISDVIEANLRAATSPAAVGEIMNIAGGARVSLHHALQCLQEISDAPVQVMFATTQHGDVGHTFADTSRANRLIGYRPQVSLREGLNREFEYISNLYRTAGAPIRSGGR